MNTLALPEAVIVNPEAKELIVTPQLEQALPHIVGHFMVANTFDRLNLRERLIEMEQGLFSFDQRGRSVPAAVLPAKHNGNTALLMYAPFADCAPQSSAETMYRYMLSDPDVSRSAAAPNTWNQLSRAAFTQRLLQAAGYDMTVVTLFGLMPTHGYDFTSRKDIRHGDFTPTLAVAKAAIEGAQERLHGSRASTKLDQIHFQGASMGAAQAIGTAHGYMMNDLGNVRSVTAQELIIGPANVPALGAQFTVRGTVGEVSELEVPDDFSRIEEPYMNQLRARNSYEFLKTNGRMLKGFARWTFNRGLTRPEHNRLPESIDVLMDNGVNVMLPLAAHSRLTHKVSEYISDPSIIVTVAAEQGHRAAHLIDEQAAVVSAMTAINVRR